MYNKKCGNITSFFQKAIKQVLYILKVLFYTFEVLFYTVLKITSGRWRPPLSIRWINRFLVFPMTLTSVSANILAIYSRMLAFKSWGSSNGWHKLGISNIPSIWNILTKVHGHDISLQIPWLCQPFEETTWLEGQHPRRNWYTPWYAGEVHG